MFPCSYAWLLVGYLRLSFGRCLSLFLICNVKFSVFVMSLLTGDVINLSFCCVQDSTFQCLSLYFIYFLDNSFLHLLVGKIISEDNLTY